MITRSYRFMVTVNVEGFEKTLPAIQEMAEEVATLVQNEEDHNFSVSVRPIEVQDFEGDETSIPLTRSGID